MQSKVNLNTNQDPVDKTFGFRLESRTVRPFYAQHSERGYATRREARLAGLRTARLLEWKVIGHG